MANLKLLIARIFSFLLLALSFQSISAQSLPIRYNAQVFDSVGVDSAVVYGNNISLATGILDFQDLLMDVYSPANDTETSRPLIILIHSGDFMARIFNGRPNGTSRDSTNVELATRWAKRGFVVASISHRLGWTTIGNEDEVRQSFSEAMYRAIQDANTCVRYFKKQFIEDANMYGIDTSKITVGGIGSGAYAALGAAYLDDPKELQVPAISSQVGIPYIQDFLLGDIEGKDSAILSRPNLSSFSSNFDLVFSIGGAIVDTSWIEEGDMPIVALHTQNDPRIPFKTDFIRFPFYNGSIIKVQGGYNMVKRSFNLNNQEVFTFLPFTDSLSLYANSKTSGLEGLYPFVLPQPLPGEIYDCQTEGGETLVRQAEHDPWNWWNEEKFISDWDDLLPNAILSGAIANCNEKSSNPDMSSEKGRTYVDTILNYITPRIVRAFRLPTNIKDKIELNSQIRIYPNPASQNFVVESSNPRGYIQSIYLYNMQGKLVWGNTGLNSLNVNVELPNFPRGMYLVSVRTKDGVMNKKILLE